MKRAGPVDGNDAPDDAGEPAIDLLERGPRLRRFVLAVAAAALSVELASSARSAMSRRRLASGVVEPGDARFASPASGRQHHARRDRSFV